MTLDREETRQDPNTSLEVVRRADPCGTLRLLWFQLRMDGGPRHLLSLSPVWISEPSLCSHEGLSFSFNAYVLFCGFPPGAGRFQEWIFMRP